MNGQVEVYCPECERDRYKTCERTAMADELKGLLAALEELGTNYAANAKKLVADPDSKLLIEIYEGGLVGALRGLSAILGEAYDSFPPDKRADFDRLVGASGMLRMLTKANEIIGAGSLNDLSTLQRASDIFDKIAKILRDIFRKLEFGGGKIPPGTTTDKQRDWTDNLIDWVLLFLRNLLSATEKPRHHPGARAVLVAAGHDLPIKCGETFEVNTFAWGNSAEDAIQNALDEADYAVDRDNPCPRECPPKRTGHHTLKATPVPPGPNQWIASGNVEYRCS
jgi:hypothetical protein